MKFYSRPCLIAAAALCAVGTAAAALLLPPAAEEVSAEPSVSSPVYTLRACEGGVGVYFGGDELTVAPIDLAALRSIDRDMFSRGVSVATWEEAVRLLEDFSP
ncbi:MAG: hypothetical protein IK136_01070 [Oscillospiraceae bacterium]|nr:hypothetical protein [Oscillospiraceae bacterium]